MRRLTRRCRVGRWSMPSAPGPKARRWSRRAARRVRWRRSASWPEPHADGTKGDRAFYAGGAGGALIIENQSGQRLSCCENQFGLVPGGAGEVGPGGVEDSPAEPGVRRDVFGLILELDLVFAAWFEREIL